MVPNNNSQIVPDIFETYLTLPPKDDGCDDFDVHDKKLLNLASANATVKELWALLRTTPLEELSWLRNKDNANKVLAVAEKFYDKGFYSQALERYECSYKLFPDDNPIRDRRIESIKKMHKNPWWGWETERVELIASLEETPSIKSPHIQDQLQRKEKCRELIATWDSAFERRLYVKAFKCYSQAEWWFSYESTKEKIKKIERLLVDKKIEPVDSFDVEEQKKIDKAVKDQERIEREKEKQENRIIRLQEIEGKRKEREARKILEKQKLAAKIQNNFSFSDEVKARLKDPPKGCWLSENKKQCRSLIASWDEYLKNKKFQEALQIYQSAYSALSKDEARDYKWLFNKIQSIENILNNPQSAQELHDSDREEKDPDEDEDIKESKPEPGMNWL